jgi:flagellar protein FliL
MAKKTPKAPKTDAPANASDSEKKPGGLLPLLLLGGVSIAASFAVAFFLSPASAPPAAVCETTADAHAPALAGIQSGQTFVELPEILISIGSEPATRYVKMKVSISAYEGGAEAVAANETILMDAFNLYLRSVEPKDFEDPSFYAFLREQLSHRAELILGGDVTDGVLITEFLLR